jgi:hypothetical protein
MSRDKAQYQSDYKCLLEFIRNLGIKPEDCLRDIGDNGYDAGSDRIKILFIEKQTKQKAAKELSEIQVIDWGKGMNEIETIASLVPASTGRQRDTGKDLGKYGIGLLASSMNICDRVEILTRSVSGAYYTYLDYNEKQQPTADEVNMVRKATAREMETLDRVLGASQTGTIVSLKQISRLPQTQDLVPNLKLKTEFLFAKGYYHLRNKFAVYIGNEVSAKRIAPYDPLERNACIDKSATYRFLVKKDKDGNEIEEYVTLQMSFIDTYRGYSERPYKKFAKPTIEGSGFSVVRNGRELCWGQSLSIFTNTGLLNNFRAELTFTGKHLDGHVFTVNAQKTEAHIINKTIFNEVQKKVKEYIDTVVEPTRSMIAEDNKVKRETSESKKAGTFAPKPVKVHPVIEMLRSLDLDNLTIKQGFDILADLKEQAM